MLQRLVPTAANGRNSGVSTVAPHMSRPHCVRAAYAIPTGMRRVRCHYTSVKDRLGEPNSPDDPEGQQQQQHSKQGSRDGGADSTHPTGEHSAPSPTAWRVRDAEGQRATSAVLRGIEAAAVAANPQQAGHPEQHRVLSTEDYSTEDDTTEGGWPQMQQMLAAAER